MKQETKTFGAGKFKAQCLKLIDEVNQTKEAITITKHGKPMARLVPIEERDYSLYGCMEGTIEVKGDIVEGTGEIWEAEQ